MKKVKVILESRKKEDSSIYLNAVKETTREFFEETIVCEVNADGSSKTTTVRKGKRDVEKGIDEQLEKKIQLEGDAQEREEEIRDLEKKAPEKKFALDGFKRLRREFITSGVTVGIKMLWSDFYAGLKKVGAFFMTDGTL